MADKKYRPVRTKKYTCNNGYYSMFVNRTREKVIDATNVCRSLSCAIHGQNTLGLIRKNIVALGDKYNMANFVTFTSGVNVDDFDNQEKVYDVLAGVTRSVMRYAYFQTFQGFFNANYRGIFTINTVDNVVLMRWFGKWQKFIRDTYVYQLNIEFYRLIRSRIVPLFKRVRRGQSSYDHFLSYVKKTMIDDYGFGDNAAADYLGTYFARYILEDDTIDDYRFQDVFSFDDDFLVTSMDAMQRVVPGMLERWAYHANRFVSVRDLDMQGNVAVAFAQFIESTRINNQIISLERPRYIASYEVGGGGHLHTHVMVDYPVWDYFVYLAMRDRGADADAGYIYDVQMPDLSSYDNLAKMASYISKRSAYVTKDVMDLGIFGARETEDGKVVRGKSVFTTSHTANEGMDLYYDADSEWRPHREYKKSGYHKTHDHSKINRLGGAIVLDFETIDRLYLGNKDDEIERKINVINHYEHNVLPESPFWMAHEDKMDAMQRVVIDQYQAENGFEKSDVEEIVGDTRANAVFKTEFALRSVAELVVCVDFVRGILTNNRQYTINDLHKVFAGVSNYDWMWTKNIDHKLNARQKDAVAMFGKYQYMMLDGGAGSGKTHTMIYIAQRYPINAQRFYFLTATGSQVNAVKSRFDNVELASRVQTLDAFVGLRMTHDGKNKYGRGVDWIHDDIDIVFVDEVERFTPMQIKQLMSVVGRDAKILFAGDSKQITGFNRHFGDIHFDMSTILPTVRLDTMMRQSARFVQRVNPVSEVGSYVIDDVVEKIVNEDYFAIAPYSRTRRDITTAVLDRLNANGRVAEVYWRGQTYSTGDRVVIRKNRKNRPDERNNSFNGEIGVLEVVFGGQYQGITITTDEVLLVVHLANGVDRVFNKREVLSGSVIEHAYAFTVHYSQGLEFDRVVAVFDDTAMRGAKKELVRSRFASKAMRYTARTRARLEYVEYVVDAVADLDNDDWSLNVLDIYNSVEEKINQCRAKKMTNAVLVYEDLLVQHYVIMQAYQSRLAEIYDRMLA
jgi:hypothetical protein